MRLLPRLVVLGALAHAGGNIAFAGGGPGKTSRPDCLFESDRDSAILAGMDKVYRMEYAAADSIFDSAFARGSAGRAFFLGLSQFNRFNDRGEAAALGRAESLWTEAAAGAERDAANRDLYLGLATLQLSYAASLRGQDLRAARLGRKAAAQLAPASDKAEAAAALALYDYYKAALLKGVEWLPFVAPDTAGPLRRLEAALPRSRYLGPVLQTSLLWLYYDAGRYDQGLHRIDAFLARHPMNRAYRQIRADFLYRRGAARGDAAAAADLAAARDIHESLKAEYAALRQACPEPACIPIGYLSSVGNLVKIYGRLGQPGLRRKHADIWFSEDHRPHLKWLPGSLKREVENRSK